jgi:hypothetical protein
MYIAVGVFGISFAELFYFALFRVASVLEGTGKGVDDEKSEQKQWNY